MTNPSTNAAIDLAAMAWGSGADDPAASSALRELGRAHREEARADFSRIHPTWLARAAREESPAVRAIVAGFGPPLVQDALRTAFGAPETPERPPHPEALEWVLALWAERLVGGEPQRDDDPPVIVALTRPSPREAYRLWHGVGQLKRKIAEDPDQRPEVRELLRRGVDMIARARFGVRRGVSLLGLATAARLLADCELFRSRWALQHLPYPVVKRIRWLTPPTAERSATASRLESRILRTVWERLVDEGRLATPFPADLDPEAPTP